MTVLTTAAVTLAGGIANYDKLSWSASMLNAFSISVVLFCLGVLLLLALSEYASCRQPPPAADASCCCWLIQHRVGAKISGLVVCVSLPVEHEGSAGRPAVASRRLNSLAGIGRRSANSLELFDQEVQRLGLAPDAVLVFIPSGLEFSLALQSQGVAVPEISHHGADAAVKHEIVGDCRFGLFEFSLRRSDERPESACVD
uniref:AMP-binding domain-containing protein n=1 Tax=Macrostomum lignano TaxID=282301 RepID=A0A1I8JMI1_9PLAT